MRYNSIFNAIQNSVWPIVPEKMDAICGFLEAMAGGVTLDAATVDRVAATNRQQRTGYTAGTIGVLPVVGVISQRMDLMSEFSGGTSTERLGREFDEMLSDTNVKKIVLDIDSPGGNYYGTPEIASKIYQARGQKPIVAQVNSMAGSAAYWIAAAADEIVMTPSGDAGSVGVLAVHYDQSGLNDTMGVKPTYIHYGRYKVEGNPDFPLSAEAQDEIQRRVDEAGETFVHALAKYRSVPPDTVRKRFGQGRMFGAEEAIERGMADRIGTLEETIVRLGTQRRSSERRKAETMKHRFRLASM